MCSMLWTKTQFISLGGYTTNAVKEKENKFLKKNTYTVVWKAQQKEILKKQKQPPQKKPTNKTNKKQQGKLSDKQMSTQWLGKPKRQMYIKSGENVRKTDEAFLSMPGLKSPLPHPLPKQQQQTNKQQQQQQKQTIQTARKADEVFFSILWL